MSPTQFSWDIDFDDDDDDDDLRVTNSFKSGKRILIFGVEV